MSGESNVTGAKKKGKRLPKTKLDRAKFKEATLRRDLNATLAEIKKDTEQTRTGSDALRKYERQKLANKASNIRSKLLSLQDEVETREYVRDTQSSKKIQNRIQQRYVNAAVKHHGLLRTTAEMEQLKADEEAIRTIAEDESGIEERLGYNHEPVESIVERRKLEADLSSVMSTRFRHSTLEQDLARDERTQRLEDVRQSLSKLGVDTPREMTEKADGLGHKYDLMREMRNLSHGHMISRGHRNSYVSIIPPYRRKRSEMEHVRRSKIRNFYEDRVDMSKARTMAEQSPRKEKVERKPKEVTRLKMSSGQTISLAKMKEFTPPGMDLTEEVSPIDC